MGKSVAYFMKWAKFLPISQNGQCCGLGITYACKHLKSDSIIFKKCILSKDFFKVSTGF